jgi:hypothetical protein
VKLEDVTKGGDDSCASFVSFVLKQNGLLKRTRSNVGMMTQDMERRGWVRTDEQVIGGVALWGFRDDIMPQGQEFGHSGLYIGGDGFISHSSYDFVPVKHSATLQDGRLPLAFFAHEDLLGNC